MNNVKQAAYQAWNDESGQDLIEYALVASLIGLAAMTSLKGVANSIKASYNYISVTLTSAL